MFTRRKMLLGTSALLSYSGVSHGIEKKKSSCTNVFWNGSRPPVFCVAYIDPGIDSQKGQEANVARYPIALVPQDDREEFKIWRDKIKMMNPDIKFLAYQMVIESTTVPGPGHRIMEKVKNAWVLDKYGNIPTVTFSTSIGGRRYRVFDPTNLDWRQRFLEACLKTLGSYDFDGLFLDQCSVYVLPNVCREKRFDMMVALSDTLDDLRSLVGNKLLIGNSRYFWPSLNGEMNENRYSNLSTELLYKATRKHETYNMFNYTMKNLRDLKIAKSVYERCIENGVYFSTSISAQQVEYSDFFDEIIEEKFINI